MYSLQESENNYNIIYCTSINITHMPHKQKKPIN